jgi:Tol biopolymer transport system component
VLVATPAAGIRAADRGPTAPAPATGLPGAAPAAAPRLPLAAHLDPPPGQTSLESVRFGGGFPGGPSAQASISDDGRYIAFISRAPDLVPGDTNSAIDVFVRDRETGTTTRLPQLGGLPVPPGGSASEPSISGDGNFVAFVYDAPQVAGGLAVVDPPPVILVWDRASGVSELASITPAGQPMYRSREPSVSVDGSRVAFTSDGSLDPADPGYFPDVFVRNRVAGTTTLVSVNVDGQVGQGASQAPSISRDGRFVAFQSDAGDLVTSDGNGETDVFVRELEAGTTELASVAAGGEPDGPSAAPAISADGRHVAFESQATNLAPGVTTEGIAVYRRDRTSATTTLVSVGLAGGDAAGSSGQAAISADGRVVAFTSTGGDLVASVGSAATAAIVVTGPSEVYARDVEAGETIRISVALAGGAAGGQNVGPAVGGTGRHVAWSSTSDVLVAGDGNKLGDVFLRDLPPVPTLAPPVIDFGTRATNTAGPPAAAILSNAGWGPLTGAGSTISGPAAVDFTVVFDGCVGRTLHRTEACTVTVSYTPTEPGERIASLAVASDAPGTPHTVTLRGGGSLAQLELDPPIGQPGIVTIATGSGFPPGVEVRLTWSRGITPKLPAIVADASGAFRVQVLVFHNDIVGQRDLVASPADGVSFPSFGAPFRVAEAGGQPPRFVIYQALDNPPPAIVGRR